MCTYEKVMQYKAMGYRSNSAKGAHLTEAMRPGSKMTLRPLLVIKNSRANKSVTVFGEAVFMDLQRTIPAAYVHRPVQGQSFHTAAARDAFNAVVQEIPSRLSIPDGRYMGLNHASPYQQGTECGGSMKLAIIELQDRTCPCCLSVADETESFARWNPPPAAKRATLEAKCGIVGCYVDRACYDAMLNLGEEVNFEAWLATRPAGMSDYGIFSASMIDRNPTCPLDDKKIPRTTGPTKILDWQAIAGQWVCHACHSFLQNHKEDLSKDMDIKQLRAARAQAVRQAKPVPLCDVSGCERNKMKIFQGKFICSMHDSRLRALEQKHGITEQELWSDEFWASGALNITYVAAASQHWKEWQASRT